MVVSLVLAIGSFLMRTSFLLRHGRVDEELHRFGSSKSRLARAGFFGDFDGSQFLRVVNGKPYGNGLHVFRVALHARLFGYGKRARVVDGDVDGVVLL